MFTIQTLVNKLLTLVKQLNYVWLTAKNSITTTKYIEYINSIGHALLLLSRGVGKVLL